MADTKKKGKGGQTRPQSEVARGVARVLASAIASALPPNVVAARGVSNADEAEPEDVAATADVPRTPLGDDIPTVDDFPKGADGKPIVIESAPIPSAQQQPATPPPPPPPQPVQQQPAAAPQGPPTPAAIAANVGVAQPQPAAAPAQPQPQEDEDADGDPFKYSERVDLMVRSAMEQGRPDVASQIQGEYANLITNQFRTLEATYERDTLPQVQQMQRTLLDFKGQRLPQELAMQANELAMQAAAQQRRMLAFMYGLVRNDATAPIGLQFFNESKLIEPGVQIERIEVRDGNVVGVDKDGNPVKLKTGQPLIFPVEDVEALFAHEFGAERKTQVLGEGGMLVDDLGNVIAKNETGRGPGGKPDDVRADVKQAADVIAVVFKAKMDPVSRMIDPDSIKDQAGYTRALAEVEELVMRGVPRMRAANQIAEKYRAIQAATKNTGPSEYSGPEFWKE